MTENQNRKKHYDLISLLQSEQDLILDKLVELESLASVIDKNRDTESSFDKIFDLVNYIFSDLAKYFCLEEDFLFHELSRVLPNPSSSAVMKDEHSKILALCNAIQEMLGVRDKISLDKELLQSEIISLSDILRRHLQKKNRVLYYEAQTLLPPAIQDEIYTKMCKRLNV